MGSSRRMERLGAGPIRLRQAWPLTSLHPAPPHRSIAPAYLMVTAPLDRGAAKTCQPCASRQPAASGGRPSILSIDPEEPSWVIASYRPGAIR